MLAGVTLVLSLVLIGLGGAVRATDSGLACPDWPFCYGKAIPLQADIPTDSGYTLWNVWLEHSHRLVASVVSTLIAVVVGWALLHFRNRPAVLWPAVAALAAVLVQATLGALVVLHLLKAGLVTAHLGMSMVVVACLVAMVAGLAPGWRWRTRSDPPGVLARPALAVTVVAFAQILVGGQVTGLYAGLAYGTDPLRFNGDVLPPWPHTAAEAFHTAHRLLAVVLACAAVALAVAVAVRYRAAARTGDPVGLHRRSWLAVVALVVLVAAQVTLGVLNLVLLTPPEIVSAHLATAGLIWTASAFLTSLEHLTPSRSVGVVGVRRSGGRSPR
jgi:cytochrome c oxidase assembly protein subunit 15